MDIKSVIAGAVIILGIAGGALAYVHPIPNAQTGQPGEPAAVEVGNKICPVSKEKVGEMGDVVKYEYNGKIYNLCCPMCKKNFAKDPKKYSKIAEDEVAAAQAAEVK